MKFTPEQMHAEKAAYNRVLLPLYDSCVLGFSNRFAWKCPTSRQLELYTKYASVNHLDVGVGTGYFIDNCRFASPPSRLVLLDINRNSLEVSARRVARYKPLALQRNLLEPLDIPGPGFDSVGMNYVLHCLPGGMETKAVVLDQLKKVMNPGAVLFGSTTLYEGIQKNLLARIFLAAYNTLGIFSNRGDTLEGLKKALAERFRESHVEAAGCSGLFVCRI